MMERYVVAAFAFMAAALWLGVGLTRGFVCLFVFVLALQATRAYQRRSDSRTRSASHAERRARVQRSTPERSRSTARPYDGGEGELDWPVASEGSW